MDEDDFGPDQNDKLFNELDDCVEFAKDSINKGQDFNRKFDIRIDLMNLIIDEVPENVRIYQQEGGSWIAEAVYCNIHFICVEEKTIPELWEDFFNNDK